MVASSTIRSADSRMSTLMREGKSQDAADYAVFLATLKSHSSCHPKEVAQACERALALLDQTGQA